MGSITKTIATNHSGWTAGDGRIYNNNVCRSHGTTGYYYLYTYGFGSLPAGVTVTGVYITAYVCNGSFETGDQFRVQLCDGVTLKGTQTASTTVISPISCSGAGAKSFGGSSSLWGLTATAMKTLIESTNFGVAARKYSTGGTMYLDGIRIIVYYTDPGYGNDVNEVLATSIASVNEVLTANINTINEV